MASNAVALVDGASLMAIEEREWGRDQIELYKATICRGATDLEMAYFLAVARRTGLEPGTQIYSVPRAGSRTIQTGIDGYRLIAQRTGEYAGSDAPLYVPEDGVVPVLCTVNIWRIVQGELRSFAHTARYSEFKRDTDPWRSMPWHMLAIACERHALKKGFPQELAGIEDADDATRFQAIPRREIRPPAPVASAPRAPSGGSSRSQLRETVANATRPAIKATVAPTPASGDEDDDVLRDELRELGTRGFDLERFLSGRNKQLDDLTREELTGILPTARGVVQKRVERLSQQG
jgi:hypothetical protein